jgi:hypothetical protein
LFIIFTIKWEFVMVCRLNFFWYQTFEPSRPHISLIKGLDLPHDVQPSSAPHEQISPMIAGSANSATYPTKRSRDLSSPDIALTRRRHSPRCHRRPPPSMSPSPSTRVHTVHPCLSTTNASYYPHHPAPADYGRRDSDNDHGQACCLRGVVGAWLGAGAAQRRPIQFVAWLLLQQRPTRRYLVVYSLMAP